MNDITQIRVGKHMTGIIGLTSALTEAAGRCRGMPDDQVGELLLKILSQRNYIEAGLEALYVQAFTRAYKKHIGEPVTEAPGEGVQIKVLGQGCAQCDRLAQEVMGLMAEAGIAAELEHVRDPAEIVSYGVMGAPALVINGQVKAVGSIPPRIKLKAWIEQAAAQVNDHPRNGGLLFSRKEGK